VLTAISEVGGTYGDWITFLRECNKEGYLTEPLAINPVPSAGRTFDRERMQSVELAAKTEDEDQEVLPEMEELTEETKPEVTASWYNPFSWWK
jgi:hypothetical protein